MRERKWFVAAVLGALLVAVAPGLALGQSKPNIVYIMGDDIGWYNIGVYHRGIMASKTPNIDKLAAEGALFTDYYTEASCTAGRANFITGQLPIRTGLTTVGQAGQDIGMPSESPTIATALKEQGYATAQFGKNHLGDLNKYLPTMHGFDEYFGWLYHLDAMQDPFNKTYPENLKASVGPRNLVSSVATDKDDPTEDPRWGKVGKQKITDEGPLPPHPTKGIKYNMETIDEEVARRSVDFIERSHKAGKPFFLWLNPSRMHVFTHLSEEYMNKITPENNWTISEAGMAQFDDVIGTVMAKLDELGISDNTIIAVTTDNGAEYFSWPDGGITPFAGTKGMVTEGGFRSPMVMRWPGKIKPGAVINGIVSGLDWFPTFVAAAGGPADIGDQLQKGLTLDGTEYKVHLDGYNQMDLLTDAGESKRHEVWYFAEANIGAARIDDYKFTFLDQPDGWFGPKQSVNWPILTNLRTDPFERCKSFAECPSAMMDFFAHEFWRFTFVQKEVAKLARTFIDFPPQQDPASFNLEQVKAKIKEVQKKMQNGQPGN
ncbi:arylsulfatase [Oceanidesulfovibrio marinus]|uniref:Arylsulfatase n=1 Tax=Oceanidesulfovibrio marinus TaxID=370038 RepID=A0ABX6NDT6_9BACT|nr:arylsulfatase [Oceanidesulfovibrio marinus]QJT08722.1 arylsulfatase [Oceanidesulfovibrio marinus]